MYVVRRRLAYLADGKHVSPAEAPTFPFYPRDATERGYWLWSCLSICLSQDSSFLLPKISIELKRGHPQRSRQMQVG